MDSYGFHVPHLYWIYERWNASKNGLNDLLGSILHIYSRIDFRPLVLKLDMESVVCISYSITIKLLST